jgi:HAD superfamily hydrolase (TIGR01509 family)
MNTLKGFFFDLDGTLVNTYEADFLAYRDAIEEVTGVRVEREDFMVTNGMEMREKLKFLTPDINPEQIPDVAAGKKKHYKKYLHLTIPNKTLISFLSDMANDHVIALVTTAKKQNAEAVIEAHGIAQYFSVSVYGDEVSNSKPHPESYLLALERAGLDAEEVLAFEDSKSGIDAAHAAGIRTIHIRSFQ